MNPPPAVSFSAALAYWLKLGFISFGGPAGQIAMMHTELVEKRRWISESRFLHALNYCMVLPGPEAQQLATYIGWLMHRTWGGIAAGVLFVLPSLVLLITLAWIYMRFGNQPVVAAILYGIKPAVTAIVLFAAWRIGTRALKSAWHWSIAAAAFVAIFAFDLPFPLIIALAALAGVIGGRLAPRSFGGGGGGHAASGKVLGGASLHDDDTPRERHMHFTWRRLAIVVAVCVALWASVLVMLIAAQGWESTLARMSWFFTKAALLTFGGAYAVLPYVFQGAVENYGWLSAPQMIDGLALGETTPGPLIMVVAFVGFVGAWTHAALGADQLVASGIAGALVVTFFTFLPSFLFIFAGAPFIESTRGNLKLAAPLSGITAAVVGVIVNLAVFFAYHTLWPDGFGGGFEWWAAIIGVAAFVALWRFKVGMIPVILACAVAGLPARLL